MGLMHTSGSTIAGLGLQEGEGKSATDPTKAALTCYELWGKEPSLCPACCPLGALSLLLGGYFLEEPYSPLSLPFSILTCVYSFQKI